VVVFHVRRPVIVFAGQDFNAGCIVEVKHRTFVGRFFTPAVGKGFQVCLQIGAAQYLGAGFEADVHVRPEEERACQVFSGGEEDRSLLFRAGIDGALDDCGVVCPAVGHAAIRDHVDGEGTACIKGSAQGQD
jgi:hypothetical protein